MTDGYNVQELIRAAHQVGLKKLLETIERQVVEETLVLTKNNCQHAAEVLGIKRTALVAKRKRLGLGVAQYNHREAVEAILAASV